MQKWKSIFLENAGPNDPGSFPFACIGNKLDKQAERQVQMDEAHEWASVHCNSVFYETSAVDG